MPQSPVQKRRVLYMDDVTWGAVKELSKREGITISEFIRKSLKPGWGNPKVPEVTKPVSAGDVWLTTDGPSAEASFGRSRPAPKPGQPRAGSRKRG